MKHIAILGASGYIGKSLVHECKDKKEYVIYPFSRKERLSYDEFDRHNYDVIINCTGIGNPKVLKQDPKAVFEVTEKIDDLILAYLEKHPDCHYINMSSGAVYLKNGEYALAKIQSEEKHRVLPNLNIVDIRVFSFFSQFADPEAGFLMSDILKAIKNKTVLETSPEDIIRDFITPPDLWRLIEIIIKKKSINTALDIYSKKPVTKFELLDQLKESFGLEYKIKDGAAKTSPTGNKSAYVPENREAKALGYEPEYASLEGIENEIKKCDIV